MAEHASVEVWYSEHLCCAERVDVLGGMLTRVILRLLGMMTMLSISMRFNKHDRILL
jgi:hypothetical protein